MKPKTKNKVPPEKLKEVKELTELVKTKNTILLSSIKNIPASQFQEIGKKLRGKAIIKFPKKNLIFKAIDSSGNEEVKKLKEYIRENTAVLFSDLDSFELAGELMRNKSPAKAKAGQEAPIDIEIEAGPTNLTPGPAISELGALGIQIQIDKGKISIKEPKIIARKGEKISQGAVDIMNKLEIKPFSIGFIPISAFDTKENKIYSEINVDREGSLADLNACFAKALAFAVAIEYPTEESIKFLIAKAASHERALNSLLSSPEENKSEEGN
jgi:large subunit ribosomal protein L10